MMLGIGPAALLLAAIAFTAWGCGSSSSPQRPTTQTASARVNAGKTLSRTELIERANVICAHINAKRSTTHYTSPADVVRLAPALSSYEQAAATEMAKLAAPSSMAKDWHQLVHLVQTVALDTLKLAEYTKSNDSAGAEAAFGTLRINHQELVSVARENDFTECTKPYT